MVNRTRYQALSALPVGNIITISDGIATGCANFIDDRVSSRQVTTVAIATGSQIIDNNLGPMLGKLQGILTTDTTGSTGDDHYSILA